MPRNGRGRGRGRGCRWVTAIPPVPSFQPHGVPSQQVQTIILRIEELEAIRLVDLEGLDQEGAAMEMGVSRKTLWLDLKSARKKIATALINGYAIRIEGGNYVIRGDLEGGR